MIAAWLACFCSLLHPLPSCTSECLCRVLALSLHVLSLKRRTQRSLLSLVLLPGRLNLLDKHSLHTMDTLFACTHHTLVRPGTRFSRTRRPNPDTNHVMQGAESIRRPSPRRPPRSAGRASGVHRGEWKLFDQLLAHACILSEPGRDEISPGCERQS